MIQVCAGSSETGRQRVDILIGIGELQTCLESEKVRPDQT